MGVEKNVSQEGSKKSSDSLVRALDRGLSILSLLGASREMSLTDIAAALKLPYSTTFRLLETLVARGFVHQAQSYGTYSIGIRAFEVGSGYMKNSLSSAARPEMEALVGELNETCNLAIRDGADAIYVDQVEGSRRVRMFTRVGARTPLHCSGVGKALLAGEPPEVVESLLRSLPLRAFTRNTVTTKKRLLDELEAAREVGYALDLEEFEVGVRCVAAPVKDNLGRTIAAISVSAPVQRFTDARIQEVRIRVVEVATSISRRLGWAEQGR